MTRKRANRANTASRTPNNVRSSAALFADIMEGSTNIRVDPRACVPLTDIRPIVRSGVQRLKCILSGIYEKTFGKGDADVFCNYIAGSDSPIVISLSGTLKKYVIKHWKSQKHDDGTTILTDAEAREKAECRSQWYGVVDGMHRQTAVSELMLEGHASWQSFTWPVTLLKGGHDIQILKQLARQQNLKHNETYYVESTFYDVLRGLRQESERLGALMNKKPSARQIAEAYDGCSHQKENTVRQTASTALRLDTAVIDAVGDIMNSEHPDLVVQQPGSSVKDESSAVKTIDCRVFRRFIHISSLKSATAFMNACGRDGIEAQINTLYRLRDVCKQQKFKPVSHRHTVEQFEKALAAIKEARKFESLLESNEWPSEMIALKKNLLQTSKLDAEVASNRGNDYDILGVILKRYTEVCPDIAPLKIQKYKAAHEELPPGSGGSEVLPREVSQLEGEEGESGPPNSAPPAGLPKSIARCGEEDKADLDEDIIDLVEPLHQSEPNGGMPAVGPDTTQPSQTTTARSNRLSVERTRIPQNLRALEEHNNASPEQVVEPDYMELLGIKMLHMKWQDYDRTVRNDDEDLFDFIITDPPYGTIQGRAATGRSYENYIDDREIEEIAQFSKRALRPGSWLFCFVSFMNFGKFYEYLSKAKFLVAPYPFTIVKDTRGMQEHRDERPQNGCEYGVFAKSPGERLDGFKVDLKSPYHLIPSTEKRKFACVSSVPVPKNKLLQRGSRSPVLTEEKNVNLLAELMTTFCPEGGSCLDMYGGTFTTAIAASITGRTCVAIEKNAQTFRLARERLRRICKSQCSELDSRNLRKKRRLNPTQSLGQTGTVATGASVTAHAQMRLACLNEKNLLCNPVVEPKDADREDTAEYIQSWVSAVLTASMDGR